MHPIGKKLLCISTLLIYIAQATTDQGEILVKLEHFYHNMPVLVTGGCGFIGSHLAQKLVELGARVTILDDLSTGSLDNIAPFKDQIAFIHDSIVDPLVCQNAVQGQRIIFHQAAYISVPGSVIAPPTCHEVNVNGTFNLLEAARAHTVERFIYASSAAVYGQKEGLCSENSQTEPVSPYGASKLIKEVYAQQYSRTYGLNTIGLRYFNVYGPRQNPHAAYSAAIAKFNFQMKNNLPITIFGDGMQTRDFISVDEVVLANLIVASLDSENTKGKIFNIATGNSITLLDMIEQLKLKHPTYNKEIEFHPARPGDVKNSGADCCAYRKIQKLISSTQQHQ